MQLSLYKFGNKAFIMTVMTSFVLLMFVALMLLYSYSHKPLSSPFFEMNTISSLSSSFDKDMSSIFQTNFSSNGTHYLISERVFSGKGGNISNRLSSYSLLLEKFSDITNASLYLDFTALNFSNVNASAKNLEYVWDYNAEELKINGSYSHLVFNFTGSSVITDDCVNSGSILLEINAGSYFSKNLSSACTIILNFSNNPLLIYFDGNGFTLNFSNAPNLSQELLIRTSNTSSFKHYMRNFKADTSSTVNPGFTEPSFPPSTNPVKHYGSVSLYGSTYNLIVIDYDNDSEYDALFIDDDSNFSDAVMKTNSSQIFLNNRGFLIRINSNGNEVSFDNILSLHYLRKNDEKIMAW